MREVLRLLSAVSHAIRRTDTNFRAIQVPALLLWGEHDRIVPLQVGQRLQRDLPHSELVVVSACAHVPHEEQPAKTLEVLLPFLEKHPEP